MTALALRGGFVVDGSEDEPIRSDIFIEDGMIIDVGASPLGETFLGKEMDVTGLYVSPGFIDMHAHSDLAVLADPEHLAKTLQGVTLEVVGQDGLGYVPATESVQAELRQRLTAWNGDPAGIDWSIRTVADYFRLIDEGAPTNVAMLAPHGTIRLGMIGDEDRPPTDREAQRMQALLGACLDEGAVGMSAGLTYAPGAYARESELIELTSVVGAAGGYYAPHHRSYGVGFMDAVQECLDVATVAHCPLHLTHCHMSFSENAGKSADLLDRLERARHGGTDVTLDSYPYLAGASYLHALLPLWSQEGGAARMRQRLLDAVTRAQIVDELERRGSDGNHGVPVDWSTVIPTSAGATIPPELVGSSVATIAEAEDRAPADTYLDLLLKNDFTIGCLVMTGNEDNVRAIMRDPTHMVGSDAILVGERPHPRGWGTFPRVLGHYARDEGVLSMPAAVARMTSRPARRLGLTDRGFVRAGYRADLVCFDPTTVRDNATYARPTLAPTGIIHVLIDGVFTVRYATRTSALPGRAIRRCGQRRAQRRPA